LLPYAETPGYRRPVMKRREFIGGIGAAAAWPQSRISDRDMARINDAFRRQR
jgi:hypothetical protein